MLTSQCDQANAQEVAVVNNVKQSCLFSVRLLCKMVGKEHTDQFIKVRAFKVTKRKIQFPQIINLAASIFSAC